MLEVKDVSRETLDKYVDLLLKWNKKINLISKSTEEDVWNRHIIDSLQLTKFIDKSNKIVDLGSGGGLPGIVLAIAGYDVSLVECDLRKMIFLKEVGRVLKLDIKYIENRVEEIELNCDIVTARGFTNINNLFKITNGIVCDKFLLLKGKSLDKEIEEANKEWNFNYKRYKSISADDSNIIEITNAKRKY